MINQHAVMEEISSAKYVHNFMGKYYLVRMQTPDANRCYNLVKLYKSHPFIEACYDIYFNEIIEYNITNEEP